MLDLEDEADLEHRKSGCELPLMLRPVSQTDGILGGGDQLQPLLPRRSDQVCEILFGEEVMIGEAARHLDFATGLGDAAKELLGIAYPCKGQEPAPGELLGIAYPGMRVVDRSPGARGRADDDVGSIPLADLQHRLREAKLMDERRTHRPSRDDMAIAETTPPIDHQERIVH